MKCSLKAGFTVNYININQIMQNKSVLKDKGQLRSAADVVTIVACKLKQLFSWYIHVQCMYF